MNKLLVPIKKLSSAENVYKNFKGIFALYKPPDVDLDEIYSDIKLKLYTGINKLPKRETESIVKIDEENNLVSVDKNLADDVLASGYKYVRRDFNIEFLHPIQKYDSGVLVGSVNDYQGILKKLDDMRLMRVYEIKGRLGVWADDFTPRGRLIARGSYLHVNRSKLDRIMCSIQAVYQREMLRYSGLDIQSQEAFEMASKGLLRPANKSSPPIIYSIRCTELDRPFFKLEVHTINESARFLQNLVHDIGLKLKAYAICVQIRRVKDGFVDAAAHSLAFPDWEFEKIYENTQALTKLSETYVSEYDKTVLVGGGETSKIVERATIKAVLNPDRKINEYSIRNIQ